MAGGAGSLIVFVREGPPLRTIAVRGRGEESARAVQMAGACRVAMFPLEVSRGEGRPNFPAGGGVRRVGDRPARACWERSGGVEGAGISPCNGFCGPPILTLSTRADAASVAQLAEHRFCKPAVVGSSPSASSAGREYWPSGLSSLARRSGAEGSVNGQMAERPMASDCKSDGATLRRFEILLCPLKIAGVAQWQSSGFPSRLLWVRFPHPLLWTPRMPDNQCYKDRCCSSAVERLLGKDEVLGSIPNSSFTVSE